MEIIQVLDLQKSNHGNFFYLNMKFFIQGLFGNRYVKSKNLVRRDGGDIFIRQPDNYSNLLDLSITLEKCEREEGPKDV